MMKDPFASHDLATRAIHSGFDPSEQHPSTVPDIVLANSFLAEPGAGFAANEIAELDQYVYTRWANPTVRMLERKVAALEGAEDALAFATGMAAITAVLLHHLSAGDHLIAGEVMYAGASELMHTMLPRFGVNVSFVDLTDPAAVQAAVQPRTRLILAETPANPILSLCDIEALAKIARQANAILAVDSTFASPIVTNPIALGAHLVIHSLTKYIGGHGDALGGIVAGKTDAITALRRAEGVHLGGSLGPFQAWLIARGAATLPIRMQAHSESALKVARFLENHDRVARVLYPGLDSHPQHELARRQMRLPSGMLTFRLTDGAKRLKEFASQLRIFHYAVSLGHSKSLIFYLPTEDLAAKTFQLTGAARQRYDAYAGEGIFRVSIGLESADDLCADLQEALAS